MKPMMVGDPSKLRIGFVARRDISKGKEQFFDYGIKCAELPWLDTDAKEIGTISENVEETPRIITNKGKARKPNRIPKDCPIPGCGVTSLFKIADCIRCVHKISDSTERRKWLDKAKEVLITIHVTGPK